MFYFSSSDPLYSGRLSHARNGLPLRKVELFIQRWENVLVVCASSSRLWLGVSQCMFWACATPNRGKLNALCACFASSWNCALLGINFTLQYCICFQWLQKTDEIFKHRCSRSRRPNSLLMRRFYWSFDAIKGRTNCPFWLQMVTKNVWYLWIDGNICRFTMNALSKFSAKWDSHQRIVLKLPACP